MRAVKVEINGRTFEVELLSKNQDSLSFLCNGKFHQAKIIPSSAPAKTDQLSGALKGLGRKVKDGEIIAPMPGIVVSLPIKVGQAVTVGDTVAVIEAMKMENSIKSPISGTIADLFVKAGSEVSTGQPLVRIKDS